MSLHEIPDLREATFATDDELREGLRMLLQRANLRQMWLIFLDDGQRIGDPLMPMDDTPTTPTAWSPPMTSASSHVAACS